MKRFWFRLERVLDLRERQEREQAQALGRAMKAEAERRRELDEAGSQMASWREQAAAEAGEVHPAGALRNLALPMAAAENQLDAAKESHQAASQSVHEERERFGDARRDRRVVERLQERRLEDWNMEGAREEQKELDDVARDHTRREEGR